LKNNLTKLDFAHCFNSSKSLVAGDLFFWWENISPARIGVIVPKKYGKAHERNLFKRRCRAHFIQTIDRHSSICIIVKPIRDALSNSAIFRSFKILALPGIEWKNC